MWGGRRLRGTIQKRSLEGVPAGIPFKSIPGRNGISDNEEGIKHPPRQRFEHSRPNRLWQMDFMGSFSLRNGVYCHPLTVIDDHSRFLVGLEACPNETIETVKARLSAIFERFGLPERMLMDNGPTWGFDRYARHTLLTAWLIRLGIVISYGRPFHLQTQDENERLNRTLFVEVIKPHPMSTLEECQTAFDAWRQVYNSDRPHEALQNQAPSSRFRPSPRSYSAVLPPVIYGPEDMIRKVDITGKIFFEGRKHYISKAFRYQPVAIRPTDLTGIYDVYYCRQRIAQISS